MDEKLIAARFKRLLHAKPRVSPDQWHTAWRQLADWSSEVPSQDLFKAMKLLDQADLAFAADDWPAFERIYQQFHKLIEN